MSSSTKILIGLILLLALGGLTWWMIIHFLALIAYLFFGLAAAGVAALVYVFVRIKRALKDNK